MYAYYPASGDLVHYAPAAVHRLTQVTSNSRLLQDAPLEMSWPEIRAVFDDLTGAGAGASVGNNIAHALAMNLRPRALKIADPNFFKVANANRVRLTYRDIVLTNRRKAEERTPFGLKNKAIGAAEQIHALDPFMQVWAYYEGVTPDNVAGFVGGNRVEPRAHYVIEETDNPDTKVFIRRAAREQRVHLIMATDLGSAVQVDVRPFDLDPAASPAVGAADAELYARQAAAQAQPGNREVFWHFVDSLIGVAYRERGEFGHLMAGRLPRIAASIPQLGSTATMAGGIIAEVVARIALGHRYPERFLIDKYTLELQTWGAWV